MRRLLLATSVAAAGTVLVGVGLSGSPVAAGQSENYRAHLAGSEEVPPNPSRGQGQLLLALDEAGDALAYKLILSNVENVVAAHLHLGEPGTNGPVVAFLHGPAPAGGGRLAGPAAEGVITDADLRGPLAGRTVADLVAAVEAGQVYANTHTNDGVPPVTNAPGDIPAGELRGQVRG